MLGLPKRVWVLAALVCVVGAQFHVWAEIDPCLWKPAPAQPHRGTAHGHGCLGCLSGSWAMTAPVPLLALSLCACRLEIETAEVSGKSHLIEVNSPRAPPVLDSRPA